MDVGKAKATFMQIMEALDYGKRDEFADFVQTYLRGREREKLGDADTVMEAIKNDIRLQLPVEAIVKSEKIMYPCSGDDANMTEKNTIHVDAFLYDEEEEDELVEAGKLSRSFCRDCGSGNTEQFNFISHSCSQAQLEIIFTKMLPDLSSKIVVDVGSRLGAVLYGAFLLSDADEIFGIEMNAEFCNLQRDIVKQYEFGSRVKIIEGDMMLYDDIISSADVIILNNVFEWFLPPEQQIAAWMFLQKTVKSGSYLVTSPSIENSLELLDINIKVDEWVEPMDNEHWSESGNMQPLFLYQVL